MSPAVDILIGIGSNIEPQRRVPEAVRALSAAFSDCRVSTFYLTKPLRGRDQAPYVNGVAAARTRAPVPDVRRRLADIEDACGRVRVAGDRYASRSLDLDLLTYGDAVLAEEALPDPDLLDRDFVLIPAAELRPSWHHPIADAPLADLAESLFPTRPNIVRVADIQFEPQRR